MDRLEDEHPAPVPHEPRDVDHRALEREAVAARHREAPEDDGVVERPGKGGVDPREHVALLEAHEPRRHERARLEGRGRHRGLREVDADDLASAALFREPPRHPARSAADVHDAAAGHVAEMAGNQRALALVPEDVERVGGPERPRHPLARRSARVPVRGDAVHRVAREPLPEELPYARRSRAVGVRRGLRHAVVSSHDSTAVSIERRARASSARAVASRPRASVREGVGRALCAVGERQDAAASADEHLDVVDPRNGARGVEAAHGAHGDPAARRGTSRSRRFGSGPPAPCRSRAASPNATPRSRS